MEIINKSDIKFKQTEIIKRISNETGMKYEDYNNSEIEFYDKIRFLGTKIVFDLNFYRLNFDVNLYDMQYLERLKPILNNIEKEYGNEVTLIIK